MPKRLVVAGAVTVLLSAGCASVHVESPLDDPRAPTTTVKRCSPSDPDRFVWFCKLGQLIYNLTGSMGIDGGYTIR